VKASSRVISFPLLLALFRLHRGALFSFNVRSLQRWSGMTSNAKWMGNCAKCPCLCTEDPQGMQSYYRDFTSLLILGCAEALSSRSPSLHKEEECDASPNRSWTY
jgi:hypothetical protein